MRWFLGFNLILAGIWATRASAEAPPGYGQVHAIFAQRCLSCHDAKEAEGDLVMDSFASLMKGGEKGVDIVPGKADESRLIRQIEHKQKPYMPPPKKAMPLPPEEIAVLRAWIDSGAPGPTAEELAALAKPTTRPSVKPTVAVRRPVLSLAYEPKLKLATAARPGEVEIWSVEQQDVTRKFQPLEGDVNAVAFSADGSRLYAAGGDPGVKGRIWAWNTGDWKQLPTLSGHADAIYSLAVSPDGKTLATGSYDQKIILWNLENGKPLRELTGHNGSVFGVAFRPDGKVLASVSADRTLKLWDVASGNRLDTRPESQKDLYALAWSPDGTRVAAGGVDNRIRIWSVSPSALEGTNIFKISQFAHDGAILRIAWSADGAWILSGADNNTVRLFDARDMSQKTSFPAQSDWPSALAFTPDSKSAMIGRIDGTIGFYDALSGQEIAAPKPVLTSISPRGIQRGHVSRIKLTGKNLGGISNIKLATLSPGKVSVAVLPDANSDEAWAELTAAADAPLVPVDLSVVSRGGESAALKVYVDDLPQLAETEPNDSPSQAQALPASSSVWGAFSPAGDSDSYSVELKQGQTLVLDVAAKRFTSKAQVELTVADSSGRILAMAGAQGEDPDPLLPFTAPADGHYTIRLSDLAGGGSGENFYRLSVGNFAYVTGTFPLGIEANHETRVHLVGYNLPADAAVMVKASAEGEATVPIDSSRFRTRRAMNVVVSATREFTSDGANTAPAKAMAVDVPSSVDGRITAAGEAGYYRFPARPQVNYVIETLAARRGSPMDTRVQVLYPDGRPVPRLQLRAVRDSVIAFRGFDANGGGARFPNYLEMDLDQYIYMNGEVVRLFRYPEGPDSEFFFYTLEGKRRCYFDTTATGHALDEKCYVVEPHAPGEALAPNGLPVFPLYYENDDDGDRLLGSDSRLHFSPPADGDYLVRVSDARNFGGSNYTYRLTVRPAAPDFAVMVENYDPNPPAGVGREFLVKLNRIDGFSGPVRVEVSQPPAGFLISNPILIERGQSEARGTICAQPDAPTAMPPMTDSGIKLTATAMVDGNPVTRLLADLKRPWAGIKSQVYVSLEPFTASPGGRAAGAAPEPVMIIPGKLTPAWLRAERHGYNGILSFDARNMPHGVAVADIGLNGVQLLEGQTERKIFIQCAPWVADMDRPCHIRVKEIANPTSPPVMLHVRHDPSQK